MASDFEARTRQWRPNPESSQSGPYGADTESTRTVTGLRRNDSEWTPTITELRCNDIVGRVDFVPNHAADHPEVGSTARSGLQYATIPAPAVHR